MPASRATSSRRRPVTRRRSPPYTGNPACWGVTLARRLLRNSRISLRTSLRTPRALLLSVMSSLYEPLPVPGGHCRGPPRQTLPRVASGWFGCPGRRNHAVGWSQQEECTRMSEKKVWFIAGAGRGLGADIASAALAAGHAVVATARNPY